MYISLSLMQNSVYEEGEELEQHALRCPTLTGLVSAGLQQALRSCLCPWNGSHLAIRLKCRIWLRRPGWVLGSAAASLRTLQRRRRPCFSLSSTQGESRPPLTLNKTWQLIFSHLTTLLPFSDTVHLVMVTGHSAATDSSSSESWPPGLRNIPSAWGCGTG